MRVGAAGGSGRGGGSCWEGTAPVRGTAPVLSAWLHLGGIRLEGAAMGLRGEVIMGLGAFTHSWGGFFPY